MGRGGPGGGGNLGNYSRIAIKKGIKISTLNYTFLMACVTNEEIDIKYFCCKPKACMFQENTHVIESAQIHFFFAWNINFT